MKEIQIFQFETLLKDVIVLAIKSLYNIEVPLNEITFQETKKEFEGDITLVVFPWIKISKKSPETTHRQFMVTVRLQEITLGVDIKQQPVR